MARVLLKMAWVWETGSLLWQCIMYNRACMYFLPEALVRYLHVP